MLAKLSNYVFSPILLEMPFLMRAAKLMSLTTLHQRNLPPRFGRLNVLPTLPVSSDRRLESLYYID